MLSVSKFVESLSESSSAVKALSLTVEFVSSYLELDSVVFFPQSKTDFRPLEVTTAELEPERDQLLVSSFRDIYQRFQSLDEVLFSDTSSLLEDLPSASKLGVSSFLVMPIRGVGTLVGLDLSKPVDSRLESAEWIRFSVESRLSGAGTQAEDGAYKKLVDSADAVFFKTDKDFNLTFLSPKAGDFFGRSAGELLGTGFFSLLHPLDKDEVEAEAKSASEVFEKELRVINLATGNVKWLLVHMVPLGSASGTEEGLGRLNEWDGFAVDITLRREALEALENQSKKVRALYTVSSAIRGYIDPANIASRGLAALCDATGADSGLCFSKTTEDELDLVSQYGFSHGFVEKIKNLTNVPSLSLYVAKNSQPVVVPDLEDDPRASKLLLEEGGVRSAVLVPICAENETLGTLGLFSKDRAKFDGGDVMLISAAANQIGLAEKQASLFTAFRRQTKALSALYRMSHELIRNMRQGEIFETAFSIMREELGLRRQWIGLLNETGTRLVGQAADGEGLRKNLVEFNIELKGLKHPFQKVIAEQKPLVLRDKDHTLDELGLDTIREKLGIQVFAIVPMISGGQLIGVLAVEPELNDAFSSDEDLGLLGNLAKEIASIVTAKRLEERIADGERMRSTGLLAAGIAHNFNNLLQAVIGQASLLALQSKSVDSGVKEKILKAAESINESANKGADLVKQLMSFSRIEEPFKEICDINDLIGASLERLNKRLKGKQRLLLNLDESVSKCYVDPGQVLRIVKTLVSNSSEAVSETGQIEIFSNSVRVSNDNPHYEVPFGDYVRVGVRDDGVGMDEEARRRCFEPFYTTRDVDRASGLGLNGSGLGLAAAYALARSNGGRLVVESRPGRGAVFTIFVPVADEFVRKRSQAQGLGKQVEVVSAAPEKEKERTSQLENIRPAN